ncbi:armadillo repeat-containing protein 1-like [Rhopilema esculentum]|uniref:armadillo repeat-containing protein 1-like n=1 Tax=Rhopilema esculentum TaxID=499914 RepID=UPI0031E1B942
MDVLSVVDHLHSLAVNPRNRAGIVKDQGCLPGLVLFLDNEDKQVILKAVKTLYLLAQHSPNRQTMKDELGMLESLKSLFSESNAEIRKYAKETHEILTGNRSLRKQGSERSTAYFGLGTSNGRAKVITLQIRGLHQATRKICEEQLLQVKGVISFTFSLPKARCIVRVKPTVQAEILCDKIAETKIMSAQQIIKNDSGEEVVLSFGKGPVVSKEKEQDQRELPDYLPEDEENTEPSDKTIARTGQKTTSNGGWLSGFSNFISNSLYW